MINLKYKNYFFALFFTSAFILGLSIIHPLLPLISLVGIIVFILLINNFPEIPFLLFLIAGVYKADERLAFITNYIDLTIFFLLLTFLSICYKILASNFKIKKIPKEVFLPYLVIVLFSLISISYTDSPIYGLDKLLRFLTITTASLFFPFFLFQDIKNIKRFFYFLIIFSIAMITDIVLGGLKPGEQGFASAFGSNYLAVGRIVGPSLLVVFLYFINKSGFLNKFILIFLSLFLTFGLFVSGGRGPVIAVFFSIFIIFFLISVFSTKELFFRMKIGKKNLKFYILCFSLFSLGFLIIMNFYDYFVTFFYRLSLLYELGGASAESRVDRYMKAIKVMTEFPTLFYGLGLGGFSGFYAGYDDKRGDYPHNIFLEIGSELGIFALLAFIFLIGSTFIKSIKAIKHYEKKNTKIFYLQLTLLALFLNMLFNSSVSGDLNDNRLLFLWISLIYVYGSEYANC